MRQKEKRDFEIPVKEVVKELAKEKGVTLSEVSERMGYPRVNPLTDMLRKGNPQLHSVWLLADSLGVSPVELVSRFLDPEGKIPSADREVIAVPYLPIHAYGSFVESYATGSLPEDYYFICKSAFGGRVARRAKSCFVVQVRGESMAPELPERTIIVSEIMPTGEYRYLNGGVYTVMVGNQFLLKRIRNNDMAVTGQLTLHSDNPNHGSLTVPAEDIRMIAKVIGIVEKAVD